MRSLALVAKNRAWPCFAPGFDEVYHLEGGILKYLETVPAEHSRWHGDCFVFDERVSVGHGLAPGHHELCRSCRWPLGPDEIASTLFVRGISCPYCHGTRSAQALAGLAERQKQVDLARQRAHPHIGAMAIERVGVRRVAGAGKPKKSSQIASRRLPTKR